MSRNKWNVLIENWAHIFRIRKKHKKRNSRKWSLCLSRWWKVFSSFYNGTWFWFLSVTIISVHNVTEIIFPSTLDVYLLFNTNCRGWDGSSITAMQGWPLHLNCCMQWELLAREGQCPETLDDSRLPDSICSIHPMGAVAGVASLKGKSPRD